MAKNMFRGATAALCAAVFIAVGCTGGTSVSPANISGNWGGALTLAYLGGGSTSGLLSLSLEQEEGFASGLFTWVPKDTLRSATARVEGDGVTLHLHFRCTETDVETTKPGREEVTTLEGVVSGSTLIFSGASGYACPTGGAGRQVTTVTAVFSRAADGAPL